MNTRPRTRPVARPAAMRRLSRLPAVSSMRRPWGSAAARLTACRRAHRPSSNVTAPPASVFSVAAGLRVASTGPALGGAVMAASLSRTLTRFRESPTVRAVTATCRLTRASRGGLAMRAPRRWAATSLVLSLLLLIVAPPLAAQTIDEIIKRGKVIVGVNTTTPIFGLAGADGQPEGYDPDVARLAAKYLGVQVEFVPVTGANRLPFLLTNRVDMVIALFGITPERAQ